MTQPVNHIAIIGASGGIGHALLQRFSHDSANKLYAFSRKPVALSSPLVTHITIDIECEQSIKQAANALSDGVRFSHIIIATGLLHDDEVSPEKSLNDITAASLARVLAVNMIGPALVAKYFLPKLACDRRAVFAAISARVGSISDNRLGGWYAYRASKAALNMLIKNISIEHRRRHKQAIVVGLHPGTVNTNLSQPFQRSVPEGKLFSPQQSAHYLVEVLEGLQPEDSGKCFAWDSQEVEA